MTVRARALTAGDHVAVVAPSGPLYDDEAFEHGLRVLESWDLEPVLMPHVHEATGYLAGTDVERASDLNAALRDPSIRGVWAARGGYGASRVVDLVDWQALREDPKVLVGFSDITALLIAARERVDLVTIHAPSVSRLGRVERTAGGTQLQRLVTSPEPLGTLDWGHADTVALVEGEADGPLVGGNLALLCSLLGTVDEPDTRGCVLFLEEVGEYPYRVDRMLLQLLRAGLLDEITGLVVGRPVACEAPRDRLSFTADAVFEDVLGGLGIPLLYGAPIGHEDGQVALPIGVEVTLDVEAHSLTLLEPAVVS